MCGHQLSQTVNGQILSLPGSILALEFLGFRLTLTRERFDDFRSFVGGLKPNAAHADCGWRKDIYVSLSCDSALQIGLDIAEWLELQDLMDRAVFATELAEMLS